MSFSIYTDVTQSQNLTMEMYATVIDNSWGCTHSGYMTTAHITSPSGRHASHQSSGLHGSVSIPILDEYGDYTVTTSGSYGCSCIFGGTAGYGGGGQTVSPRRPAGLASVPEDQFTYTSPGNYLRTRIWQVKDQHTAPWNYIGPVSESFEEFAGENGCNLTIIVDSTFTNNQGRFQDRYGNHNNQPNPIPACAPQYNPVLHKQVHAVHHSCRSPVQS